MYRRIPFLLAFAAMLAVRYVGYTYPGAGRAAVADLEFTLGPGEAFGLVGPDAAGKSTTRKILTGLIRDYSGRVEFEGRELKDWGRDFFERIGVSFGHPSHFLMLTARENLAYSASLYSGACEDVSALLERVGLADSADRRVKTFSEGMMNRLGLARALLHRPRALFLDEPTAGLDPESAREMSDLIREQKESGRAIFLATRDRAVADGLCDRVALIANGIVMAPGRGPA